jgi:uncharacterized membrane protein
VSGGSSSRVAGRRATLVALAAITLLGAALRVFRVGFDDYWIDEVASIQIAQGYSILGLFIRLPFVDRHPGLFYATLKVWMATVGETAAATRLLPALFGIAAIPMLYLLGKRLFGLEVGLVAAALLALSRFHLFHSQNLRMYSLFVLLALVSTYLLLDLRVEQSRRTVGAYVAAAVLLGNTHFFGVLVIAGHLVYILGTEYVVDARTATGPSRFVTSQFAVGVGIAPGVAGLLGQLVLMSSGADRALGWIEPPTALWPLEAVGTAIRRDAPLLGLAALALVLTVAVGMYWWRHEVSLAGLGVGSVGDERTYLLAGLVVFPIAVPFVVSLLFRPPAVVRYTVTASVDVYLAVAGAVSMLPSRAVRYGLVGLVLVTMVAGLPSYYTGGERTEWSSAATTVTERGGENPFVVNTHPFTATFRNYLERQGGGELHEQRHWDRSVIRDARSADRPIWVVRKPDGKASFARGLERESNYTTTLSEQYVGVGVTRYELTNETD